MSPALVAAVHGCADHHAADEAAGEPDANSIPTTVIVATAATVVVVYHLRLLLLDYNLLRLLLLDHNLLRLLLHRVLLLHHRLLLLHHRLRHRHRHLLRGPHWHLHLEHLARLQPLRNLHLHHACRGLHLEHLATHCAGRDLPRVKRVVIGDPRRVAVLVLGCTCVVRVVGDGACTWSICI